MSLFERVNVSQHCNTRHSFNAHISPKVSSYGKSAKSSLPDEIQSTFSKSLFRRDAKIMPVLSDSYLRN